MSALTSAQRTALAVARAALADEKAGAHPGDHAYWAGWYQGCLEIILAAFDPEPEPGPAPDPDVPGDAVTELPGHGENHIGNDGQVVSGNRPGECIGCHGHATADGTWHPAMAS